jgi:hypothetical protein
MSEVAEKKAAEKKEDFNQVCVWPGTLVGKEKVKEFEEFLKESLGARTQYLEEFETLPDTVDYSGETGGRNDVLFAVHKEDVSKFALARLQFGMRWIEDVLDNAERSGELSIYPPHIKDYRTW